MLADSLASEPGRGQNGKWNVLSVKFILNLKHLVSATTGIQDPRGRGKLWDERNTENLERLRFTLGIIGDAKFSILE